MRQGQAHPRFAPLWAVLVHPAQKEGGKFFLGGARKAERANVIIGGMDDFTQQLRHSQGRLAVLAQELEEGLARDKIRLNLLQALGRYGVGLAGDGSRQPHYLPALGESENYLLPFGRGGGKLRPAARDHEQATRSLALNKENSTLWIGGRNADRRQRFQGVLRKIAEQPFLGVMVGERTSRELGVPRPGHKAKLYAK